MAESREPSEMMQEIVEQQGDKVAIHTADCVTWKAEHPNCFGCPSELGCGKTVRLMLITATTLMYQPRDYDDFAKMQSRLDDLMQRTLQAKTVAELKSIPTH
jgi:hypothetical protein